MGCRQRPRGITVSRLIAAIALLAALPALAVPSPASLAFRDDRSRRASGDSPLAPSFIDLRALAEGYRLAPKAKDAEPLRVQTGNPHPYPNYPAMGLPFAAFIQYYRDR